MKSLVKLISLCLLILSSIFHSCKKEEIPTLTTASVTNITGTTATSGGTITDEGSGTIVEQGICWSKGITPTIADDRTIESGGTATFVSNMSDLNGATTYYVKAYATNNAGIGYGMEMSFATLGAKPIALSKPATNIVTISATLNGTVNANYLSTTVVFEYGMTTNYDQTVIAMQSTVTGGANIDVSANLAGLASGTMYHYRVKVENSLGITYSEDMSFITQILDKDGNVYNYITIGMQVWMVENLKTTKYSNGEFIGTTSPASLDISTENEPKYQWACGDDESNITTYGRLYTWYAVTESRNICPTGWHIPTDAEWTVLTDYLTNNGYGYEGSGSDIAKSMASTSGWFTFETYSGSIGNDQVSNNSSGFTALPGGFRSPAGKFIFDGQTCQYWSVTEIEGNALYALSRQLVYMSSAVGRFNTFKKFGFSVRCLKDE